MFEAIREKLRNVWLSKEERWERLDKMATSHPEKYRHIIDAMKPEDLAEYMQSSVDSIVIGGCAFTQVIAGDDKIEVRPVPVFDVIDPQPGYNWHPGKEHEQPPARKKPRPGVFERPAMNRQQRRKADAVARRAKAAKDKA